MTSNQGVARRDPASMTVGVGVASARIGVGAGAERAGVGARAGCVSRATLARAGCGRAGFDRCRNGTPAFHPRTDVMPAHAGIHFARAACNQSRFRGNDVES
jgi:uncharacterized Ntn-hydrolase superfamily protein